MKMIYFFMAMTTSAMALSGCEKKITIQEFKENDALRAEWIEKCKNDSGFENGNCKNAATAEHQIRMKRAADYYN